MGISSKSALYTNAGKLATRVRYLQTNNMGIPQQSVDAVLQYVFGRFDVQRTREKSVYGKPRPFVLGLSGMQGSGKSTWAKGLAATLRTRHGLKVVLMSLDDLYHTHENLVMIRNENPSNDLFRNRGQPGTHDEILAEKFFSSLLAGEDVTVPSFDKSCFNGEGNRAPVSEWEKVSGVPPVDVLIFEGWCVGFQALSNSELEQKWESSRQVDAKSAGEDELSTMIMRNHPLEHLRAINDHLRRYNETFLSPSRFDYFVHLDTPSLSNVFRWRIQQEEALRREKGAGMTNEEVVEFVKVYMPAYELYLDRLRHEAFPKPDPAGGQKTQLRVVLDKNRTVTSMCEL